MRKTTLPASVAYLYERQGEWDHNPPYQRPGGQWSLPQKQKLIDSLLNNFAVPTIYLHELPRGSRHRFSVIDGKQRLETIREFIDGRFALHRDFTLFERFDRRGSAPRGGDGYADLASAWREEFIGAVISVEELAFADEENAEALVRQIFLRLNAGTKVSRAHMARVRDQVDELERRR